MICLFHIIPGCLLDSIIPSYNPEIIKLFKRKHYNIIQNRYNDKSSNNVKKDTECYMNALESFSYKKWCKKLSSLIITMVIFLKFTNKIIIGFKLNFIEYNY